MNGETIGLGESIKATVVKANADASISPFILIISLLFFMFLCYMAWNKRKGTPITSGKFVRRFTEDNE